MFDASQFIAVTDRRACEGDLLACLERVAAVSPRALILREKDLNDEAYTVLARQVMALCARFSVPCFLHGHAAVARRLSCPRIHLSIPALREMHSLADFDEVSVSCHSLADVREAEAAGASQVLLGNIFETACKPGLAGKGLPFLREICNASSLPVYAIGGITPQNLPQVLDCGAAGGCMRSGFMRM